MEIFCEDDNITNFIQTNIQKNNLQTLEDEEEIIVGIDSNDTTVTGNDIKSDAAGNEKRSANKELGGKRRKRVKKH